MYGFLTALLLFAVPACKCKQKSASKKDKTSDTKVDYEQLGYSKATVIQFDLDGCAWMIEFAEKERMEPLNLPEEFKKDQTKIWVQYELEKKAVSACMAGKIIRITEIRKRE
jgi:hypothetical protein